MRLPGGRLTPVVGAVAAVIAVAGCQDPVATGSSDTTTGAAATTTAAQAAKEWKMPDLVGTNLQTAQNKMQSVTGDPIFLTSSHDATGRQRMQVFDRDWNVCTQNIPPGTLFNLKSKIDFGAVKLTESCPK
ncbi:MAG TPA: hypothetical protein VFX16_15455 [Pseudonocardiaceae bacterium]|nr:hypothetical protein [Pseudonocardiaceae bacterium]